MESVSRPTGSIHGGVRKNPGRHFPDEPSDFTAVERPLQTHFGKGRPSRFYTRLIEGLMTLAPDQALHIPRNAATVRNTLSSRRKKTNCLQNVVIHVLSRGLQGCVVWITPK